MRLPLHALSVFLLASLLALAAGAKTLHGVVIHVTDGDTIWVRPAGGAPVQVRIQGLDAPEICQAFGQQARDALAARLLHREVLVSTRARDIYQRSVGNVSRSACVTLEPRLTSKVLPCQPMLPCRAARLTTA